jgi:hypothetical protein
MGTMDINDGHESGFSGNKGTFYSVRRH